MFKKIGLLSLFLIAFSFALYACANPYEDMKLTVNSSEVVLYLNNDDATASDTDTETTTEEETTDQTEEETTDTTSEQQSEYVVTATVSGLGKNVSSDVVFTQLGNAVSISNITKTGDVTEATLIAKNTGRSVITVNTKEGNKRQVINVTVYRTVSGIAFEDDMVAIASTGTLDLADHIVYTPADTNQTEVNFYIDDPDATVVATDDLGFVTETSYAKIENGILTITNPNSVELPFDYVSLVDFVPVVGYSAYDQELVTETKEIPIMDVVAANEIELYTNTATGNVQLTQNALGQYEIVLGSNVVDDTDVFSRDLQFIIGANLADDKNYRVTLQGLDSTSSNVVDVAELTNHTFRKEFNLTTDLLSTYQYNNFVIDQINNGEAILNFEVDYYNFEGVFTIPITVKVTVKELPTELLLETEDGTQLQDGDTISIYNQYAQGVLGEYLKVTANPELDGITYSVAPMNASSIVMRNANGTVLTAGNVQIASGNAIYFTHNYENELPTNGSLVIMISYNLAPIGVDDTFYTEYTIEVTLNVDLKIGLSELTVPSEMLINVANSTMISGENQTVIEDLLLVSAENTTVSVYDAIEQIRFVTFNDVNVANIAGFDMDPFNNEYFSLDYDTEQNAIFVVPNQNGLAMRARIQIRTFNGIFAESYLNLFVPLAYANATTPYVEVIDNNGVVFDMQTRGYNVSVSDANNISVALAKDEDGITYNEIGEVVVGEDALSVTYETTVYLNLTTSSSVELNFYNYIVNTAEETAQIDRINYNSRVLISSYSQNYFAVETNATTGARVLRTKSLPTTGEPQQISINFTGYTELGVYVVRTFVLQVDVTRPLQSISVTPSSKLLYDQDSVGALNTSVSQVALATSSYPVVSFDTNTNVSLIYSLQNQMVYTYQYKVSPQTTIVINGQTINYLEYVNTYLTNYGWNSVVQTDENGNIDIIFNASDVVTLTENGLVTAQMQDSFYDKIKLIYKLAYFVELDDVLSDTQLSSQFYLNMQNNIINNVYAETLHVRVYATVTQFNNLPLYSYADISIVRATKVENIIVSNVTSDGLYFDTRLDNSTRTITFSVLPSGASNKNLIATVGNNTIANITKGVSASGVVTGNSIEISRLRAGTTILRIAAQDSFATVTRNGVTSVEPTVYVEFRIQVSDGTEANPFEIRTTQQFLDIENYSSNFHYVIAQDINLTNVDFEPFSTFNGGLNGLFTYYNTGIYYTRQNTIYGFTLQKQVEIENSSTGDYEEASFGLFEALGANATISNLKMEDVFVEIIFNKQTAQTNNTEFDKIVTVGAIAGASLGTIVNPMISGSVVLQTNVGQQDSGSMIWVGGLVGALAVEQNEGEIAGKLVGNQDASNSSFNNDNLNVNMDVTLISDEQLSTAVPMSNKFVGGVAGYAVSDILKSDLLANSYVAVQDLVVNAVVASYYDNNGTYELNTANVGGVFGYSDNLTMSNLFSTSRVLGYQFVGGISGVSTNTYLTDSVVQFYENGNSGQHLSGLVATNYVGGLYGVAANVDITYSYARSYISRTIDNNEFYGDILLLNGSTNLAGTQVYAGGLIGYLLDISTMGTYVAETSVIASSYFNASINADSPSTIVGELVIGGLVGGATNTSNLLTLQDVYTKARIDMPQQQTVETVWVDVDENTYVGSVLEKSITANVLTETTTQTTETTQDVDDGQGGTKQQIETIITTNTTKQFGLFVGQEIVTLNQSTSSVVNGDVTTITTNLEYQYDTNNMFTILTSYGVVNDDTTQKRFAVVNNTQVFVAMYENYSTDWDELNQTTTLQNTFKAYSNNLLLEYRDVYGFNISDGTTYDVYDWIMYSGLNNNYPLLMNQSNSGLLFRVLPSSIVATIVPFVENGNLFNNMAYIKVDETRLVLFYNARVSGSQVTEMNRYYVLQDGEDLDDGLLANRVISVNLNVDLNANSIFQPEIDGSLIMTSSNTNVVSVLSGGVLQTKGVGQSDLTIASKTNPSIFTTVSILVVNGVSEIDLHNTEDANLDTTVYVDDTSFYTLDAYNTYSSAVAYATYIVNNSVGYIVSVDDENTGNVQLNNQELLAGNDYVYTSLTEFNLTGVQQGLVHVTITPFIVTTNNGFGQTLVGANTTVEHAILIEDTSMTISRTFNVYAKATSIHTNNFNTATISPQTGTNVTVTVVTSAFDQEEYAQNGLLESNIDTVLAEQILVTIVDQNTNQLVASIDDLKLGANSDGQIENTSLLMIVYNGFSVVEQYNQSAQMLQLQISFSLTLQFDQDSYRNANNGNTINLNEQSYELQFSPSSNEDLQASFVVNILPNTLSNISASFYAGGEYTTNNETGFNPNEESTNYIAPGKVGLLKLYLFPEFNNAEYVELTVNSEFRNYVSYQQMLEYQTNSGVVQSYVQTGYPSYLLEDNQGIRLRNLSYQTANNSNIVFNGSMFVQITLSSVAPTTTNVVFTATAYKTVNGVKTVVANSVDVSLQVQPLPSIDLRYEDEKTGIIAIGTEGELTVDAYNYEGDISLSATVANGLNTSVETYYDQEQGKWMLRVLSNAVLGDTITIVATATRNINGAEEEATSKVTLQIVEYLVQSISLNNASGAVYGSNSFEVLNGTSNELSVTVAASYNEEALNGTIPASVALFERLISGKVLAENASAYINNWYHYYTSGGVTSYDKLVSDYVYGNVFKFSRTEIDGFNQVSYYSINALMVDSGTYTLAFRASYYYDTQGKVQPYTEDVSGVDVYETDWIKFSLIVKDNSTYDHPNPITNLQEFINMESGIHYILTSDIDINVNNYEPMDATFASLDGNGYVININGMNLSKYEGQSSVTTGLFESISAGTLLKNITLNVADMLMTKAQVNEVLNQNLGQSASTKLNLSEIRNVTFGILAGQNNGTITNAKVVAIANESEDETAMENKLLFVYTTQNFIDNSEAVAQIGGLVGSNGGSISNSYIGLDYYTLMQKDESQIERVNTSGDIVDVHTTSFALAAGKQVAGFVYSNSGTISNSYNKAVGVINVSPIFSNTQSAGFAISNTGYIYSSFVEGLVTAGVQTNNYRANDTIYIEAKGYIGGFVYNNNGEIFNAYSNITINTNSGGSGGFVYINAQGGSITNAYAAGNNHASNSLANGLFTGVDSTNEFNNFGTYESVYYLLKEDETENVNEPAEAILSNGDDGTEGSNPFRYPSSFSEFSFVSGNQTENGIWIMNSEKGQYGPQLVNAVTYNTMSYRTIQSTSVDPNNPESVINNYSYIQNEYGTQNNPILINTATDFLEVVLTYTKTYYSNNSPDRVIYVFGAEYGTETDKNYLRLVNNLDFEEVVLNDIVINNLRISDVIFAGNLDGNGMEMSGISLVDLKKDQNNENYGFFNQVGLSNAQFAEFINADLDKEDVIKPTIKNLSISIGSFDATNSIKVGGLAGSIYDSNLININLSGSNNVVVQGRNLVGGLAGLIKYETNAFTMIGVTVDNVWVSASYRNFTIEDYNPVTVNGFATRTVGSTTTALIFKSYYHNGTTLNDLQQYSYAGAISGVLDAVNRLDSTVPQTWDEGESVNANITQLRSQEISSISNLQVVGGGRIIAEQVGGLFGYVGQNTHIMKSSYTISARDSAVSTLMGYNYAGGLIGENYGFLEKVFVEYDEELQIEYDETIAEGSASVLGIGTLFGTNVSISIGGLVGYADNSVILDSYTKVNVKNASAKIAGGVIGLATRANYLSHVYTTSSVYGKYVIGGVVGLYNQSGKGVTENRGAVSPTSLADNSSKLYMDYVVALNAWSSDTKAVVDANLQEYYRKLQVSGSAYYSFATIMPEIGNLMPTITDAGNLVLPEGQSLTVDEQTRYNAIVNGLTPTVYVGSLVGRVSLNAVTANDYDSNSNLLTANGSDGLYKALVLARVADTIIEDQYVSTVASTSFVQGGSVIATNPTLTNVWPTATNESAVGDIIAYNSIVGDQDKNNAITGNSDSVGNYFRTWILDESDISQISSDTASKVWKISETNAVLPEYIVGIYSNYKVIDTMAELQELLENSNTEKQYFILKPNTDSNSNGVYTFDNPTGYNLFTYTFKGVLVGETQNGVVPKIAVDFNSTNTLGSVFGNLDSATINGIDFDFTFITTNSSSNTFVLRNNTGADTDAKNSIYYGLFVRNATNSVLTNINITVNSKSTLGEYVATTILQPVVSIQNIGMMVGNLFNGSVSNFDVHFKTNLQLNTLSLTSATYISPVIAKMTDGELNNVNVFGYENEMIIDTSSIATPTLYVGGVVSYVAKNVSTSTLDQVNTSSYLLSGDINTTNMQIRIANTNAATVLYVGGVVGYADAMSLDGGAYYGQLSVGTDAQRIKNSVYVGGIGGYIASKSDVQNVFVNVNYDAGYVRNKLNASNPYSILVYGTHQMTVGGFVGMSTNTAYKSTKETVYNEQTVMNTSANGSDILVYSAPNSTRNVYIGGFVGRFVGTQDLGISKAVNIGKINIVATTQHALLQVGGAVGLANRIELESVYGYGDINFTTTTGQYYVGGLVGRMIANATISEFVVYGDINNVTQTNAQNLTRTIGGVVGNVYDAILNLSNGISLAKIYNITGVSDDELAYVNAFAVLGQGGIYQNAALTNVYAVYELLPIQNTNVIGYADLSLLNGTYEQGYVDGDNSYTIPGVQTQITLNAQALGAGFAYNSNATAVLILPNLLDVIEIAEIDENNLFAEGGKLNPTTVTAQTGINTDTYQLLKADVNLNAQVSSEFNGVLVGVLGTNGYPTITHNAASAMFATNNGVLANMSIKNNSTVLFTTNNAFGVNTNNLNGWIVNMVTYGYQPEGNSDFTTQIEFSGLVNENNGRMFHVGSSMIIDTVIDNSNTEFAGLVHTNNGYIDNAYVTSVFTSEDNNFKFAGLVFNNTNGQLQNAYFGGYVRNDNESNVKFTDNDNVMIYSGNSATYSNIIFDKNAIQISMSPNNKLSNSTNYIAENDSNGESLWMQETDDNQTKYTSAFTLNQFDINFGYPTIVNGVQVETMVYASYNASSLDISSVSYFLSQGSSNFIPIYHSGMLANIAANSEFLVTTNRGYLLLNDIYVTNFNARVYDEDDDNYDNYYGRFVSLGKLEKVLLGNNKTIYDIELNRSSVSGLYSTGLFSQIDGGSVGNLTLNNVTNLYKTYYTGTLAGYMNKGVINNITVVNANLISSNSYVGGVIGYAGLIGTGNTVANINVSTDNNSVIYGNGGVGGLFGVLTSNSASNNFVASNLSIANYNIFSDSTYDSSIANALAVGGVIGYANTITLQNLSNTNTDVNGNNAIVYNDTTYSKKELAKVGGIVGYVKNSTIQFAQNSGDVFGVSAVGGIAGYAEDTAFVGEFGNVITSSGDVGWSEIKNTTNIGGIVGYFKNSNMNYASATSGSIYGGANVGGIVGYIDIEEMDFDPVITNVSVNGIGIRYRSTSDIDGDDGSRDNIYMDEHENDTLQAFYDNGSTTYFGLGVSSMVTESLFNYQNNLSIELGGLDANIWNKTANNSYRIPFGYIYGYMPYDLIDFIYISSQVINATYANTSILDLYDTYTIYDYEANYNWVWLGSDTVDVKVYKTTGKREFDTVEDVSSFKYGNTLISKVHAQDDANQNVSYYDYSDTFESNDNRNTPDGKYGVAYANLFNYKAYTYGSSVTVDLYVVDNTNKNKNYNYANTATVSQTNSSRTLWHSSTITADGLSFSDDDFDNYRF